MELPERGARQFKMRRNDFLRKFSSLQFSLVAYSYCLFDGLLEFAVIRRKGFGGGRQGLQIGFTKLRGCRVIL